MQLMSQTTEDGARLIERECGGWLAIAGADSPVRVAVTAPDERSARDALRRELDEWRRLLARAEDGAHA